MLHYYLVAIFGYLSRIILNYFAVIVLSWQLEVVPAKHFGIRMPTWVRLENVSLEAICLLHVLDWF